MTQLDHQSRSSLTPFTTEKRGTHFNQPELACLKSCLCVNCGLEALYKSMEVMFEMLQLLQKVVIHNSSDIHLDSVLTLPHTKQWCTKH